VREKDERDGDDDMNNVWRGTKNLFFFKFLDERTKNPDLHVRNSTRRGMIGYCMDNGEGILPLQHTKARYDIFMMLGSRGRGERLQMMMIDKLMQRKKEAV
jgi:hypothetical protein